MTPAKRALLESLIRHARGMLTACEKYLSESNYEQKRPGDLSIEKYAAQRMMEARRINETKDSVNG